ncbi:MAG: hypothetical protein MHM6MM_005726, partial [Cercozoa sp. M6MM]
MENAGVYLHNAARFVQMDNDVAQVAPYVGYAAVATTIPSTVLHGPGDNVLTGLRTPGRVDVSTGDQRCDTTLLPGDSFTLRAESTGESVTQWFLDGRPIATGEAFRIAGEAGVLSAGRHRVEARQVHRYLSQHECSDSSGACTVRATALPVERQLLPPYRWSFVWHDSCESIESAHACVGTAAVTRCAWCQQSQQCVPGGTVAEYRNNCVGVPVQSDSWVSGGPNKFYWSAPTSVSAQETLLHSLQLQATTTSTLVQLPTEATHVSFESAPPAVCSWATLTLDIHETPVLTESKELQLDVYAVANKTAPDTYSVWCKNDWEVLAFGSNMRYNGYIVDTETVPPADWPYDLPQLSSAPGVRVILLHAASPSSDATLRQAVLAKSVELAQRMQSHGYAVDVANVANTDTAALLRQAQRNSDVVLLVVLDLGADSSNTLDFLTVADGILQVAARADWVPTVLDMQGLWNLNKFVDATDRYAEVLLPKARLGASSGAGSPGVALVVFSVPPATMADYLLQLLKERTQLKQLTVSTASVGGSVTVEETQHPLFTDQGASVRRQFSSPVTVLKPPASSFSRIDGEEVLVTYGSSEQYLIVSNVARRADLKVQINGIYIDIDGFRDSFGDEPVSFSYRRTAWLMQGDHVYLRMLRVYGYGYTSVHWDLVRPDLSVESLAVSNTSTSLELPQLPDWSLADTDAVLTIRATAHFANTGEPSRVLSFRFRFRRTCADESNAYQCTHSSSTRCVYCPGQNDTDSKDGQCVPRIGVSLEDMCGTGHLPRGRVATIHKAYTFNLGYGERSDTPVRGMSQLESLYYGSAPIGVFPRATRAPTPFAMLFTPFIYGDSFRLVNESASVRMHSEASEFAEAVDITADLRTLIRATDAAGVVHISAEDLGVEEETAFPELARVLSVTTVIYADLLQKTPQSQVSAPASPLPLWVSIFTHTSARASQVQADIQALVAAVTRPVDVSQLCVNGCVYGPKLHLGAVDTVETPERYADALDNLGVSVTCTRTVVTLVHTHAPTGITEERTVQSTPVHKTVTLEADTGGRNWWPLCDLAEEPSTSQTSSSADGDLVVTLTYVTHAVSVTVTNLVDNTVVLTEYIDGIEFVTTASEVHVRPGTDDAPTTLLVHVLADSESLRPMEWRDTSCLTHLTSPTKYALRSTGTCEWLHLNSPVLHAVGTLRITLDDAGDGGEMLHSIRGTQIRLRKHGLRGRKIMMSENYSLIPHTHTSAAHRRLLPIERLEADAARVQQERQVLSHSGALRASAHYVQAVQESLFRRLPRHLPTPELGTGTEAPAQEHVPYHPVHTFSLCQMLQNKDDPRFDLPEDSDGNVILTYFVSTGASSSSKGESHGTDVTSVLVLHVRPLEHSLQQGTVTFRATLLPPTCHNVQGGQDAAAEAMRQHCEQVASQSESTFSVVLTQRCDTTLLDQVIIPDNLIEEVLHDTYEINGLDATGQLVYSSLTGPGSAGSQSDLEQLHNMRTVASALQMLHHRRKVVANAADSLDDGLLPVVSYAHDSDLPAACYRRCEALHLPESRPQHSTNRLAMPQQVDHSTETMSHRREDAMLCADKFGPVLFTSGQEVDVTAKVEQLFTMRSTIQFGDTDTWLYWYENADEEFDMLFDELDVKRDRSTMGLEQNGTDTRHDGMFDRVTIGGRLAIERENVNLTESGIAGVVSASEVKLTTDKTAACLAVIVLDGTVVLVCTYADGSIDFARHLSETLDSHALHASLSVTSGNTMIVTVLDVLGEMHTARITVDSSVSLDDTRPDWHRLNWSHDTDSSGRMRFFVPSQVEEAVDTAHGDSSLGERQIAALANPTPLTTEPLTVFGVGVEFDSFPYVVLLNNTNLTAFRWDDLTISAFDYAAYNNLSDVEHAAFESNYLMPQNAPALTKIESVALSLTHTLVGAVRMSDGAVMMATLINDKVSPWYCVTPMNTSFVDVSLLQTGNGSFVGVAVLEDTGDVWFAPASYFDNAADKFAIVPTEAWTWIQSGGNSLSSSVLLSSLQKVSLGVQTLQAGDAAHWVFDLDSAEPFKPTVNFLKKSARQELARAMRQHLREIPSMRTDATVTIWRQSTSELSERFPELPNTLSALSQLTWPSATAQAPLKSVNFTARIWQTAPAQPYPLSEMQSDISNISSTYASTKKLARTTQTLRNRLSAGRNAALLQLAEHLDLIKNESRAVANAVLSVLVEATNDLFPRVPQQLAHSSLCRALDAVSEVIRNSADYGVDMRIAAVQASMSWRWKSESLLAALINLKNQALPTELSLDEAEAIRADQLARAAIDTLGVLGDSLHHHDSEVQCPLTVTVDDPVATERNTQTAHVHEQLERHVVTLTSSTTLDLQHVDEMYHASALAVLRRRRAHALIALGNSRHHSAVALLDSVLRNDVEGAHEVFYNASETVRVVAAA